MSSSNFASLTANLLVRKGEAKPSPITGAVPFPVAHRAARCAVDAPVPAGPAPECQRPELSAPSSTANFPAATRRMFLRLSAREYEIVSLLAVKKGTTPQHLLRQALHEFVAEFARQCGDSCHCIQSGWDETGEAL